MKMDPSEIIAERKIREALAEGAFENLKVAGQPLDLEENPYEDPSTRMGHRLLRNNGFAPAWIEEAKDLEREIDELIRSDNRNRERIAEINCRILAHNLKTPSTRFHIEPLDV